ncbi:MAG: hypothetical protein U9Q17_01790 [Chloroflexota bacterium]|nr:hypothetical protein [Chloroflexota bacterium]
MQRYYTTILYVIINGEAESKNIPACPHIQEIAVVRNRYSQLGLGLLLAGLGLIPTAYSLLRSVPLIALGLSLLILGATCLVLGKTRPRISPEVSNLLMETSLENLGALLEELGLKSKGIYLPSVLAGGKPRAVIPLRSNPHPPDISHPLPNRLIVSCGLDPDDMGIMVTTPGSEIISMLQSKPGPSPDEIASALTSVLMGTLDLASSVNISLDNQTATIRVGHPNIRNKRNSWAERSLGSPIASIAASVLAEALETPVIVDSERLRPKEDIVELKTLAPVV